MNEKHLWKNATKLNGLVTLVDVIFTFEFLDLHEGLFGVLLRFVHVTGLHRVHDSDDVHQHTQVLLQDQKVTLAKSLALLKSVLAD